MPAPLVEFIFQAVLEGSTELIHHKFGNKGCLVAFGIAVGIIVLAIVIGKLIW